MQIRFLLGPAGTGKTWRCVDEAQKALLHSASGAPLLFLAPKQATYQLERQILAEKKLKGFSRLHILSFERLARFIFRNLQLPWPRLLNEQGRTMVLRAILARSAGELKIFQNSARRIGFAQELSEVLREFQQCQLSPLKLEEIANIEEHQPHLRDKLLDLALLTSRYHSWLQEANLRDPEALLGLASDALRAAYQKNCNPPFIIEELWLDGFAQMTPAERLLILHLLPFCKKATLAFCLQPGDYPPPSLSPWMPIHQTVEKIRTGIKSLYPNAVLMEQVLERKPQVGRFAAAPLLAHIEANWGTSQAFNPSDSSETGALQIDSCLDIEAEAANAARHIVRHVRYGGRYRDTALLVRNLEAYHQTIQRVFQRYQIPCFIDRRESVSHHPLAELTRGALRTLLFGWKIADLFRTLKSGLFQLDMEELDFLENGALAHGWEGDDWQKDFVPRQTENALADYNRLRSQVVTPLIVLSEALGTQPSGSELVAALRQFWKRLRVQDQLGQWSIEEHRPLHNTVLEQMQDWLQNLELAFGDLKLPLKEWLPILDAGLATLTVGVIPPALDQVLVGAIDRSRNPDLKLVIVLGVNEGIFPLPPRDHKLLNETERARLADHGILLAPLAAMQLSQEQFYGYIACTRARQKLILSFSEMDNNGKAINPSRFIGALLQLCPSLIIHKTGTPADLHGCDHQVELYPLLFRCPIDEDFLIRNHLSAIPRLKPPSTPSTISREVISRLYKGTLAISISDLETLAKCPFQFFASKALRARERLLFELDFREEGSFKHEVLAAYHEKAVEQFGAWKSVPPLTARKLIGEICDSVAGQFRGGMLLLNSVNQFRVQAYKRSLQDFIEIITLWLQENQFQPIAAELGFGAGNPLKAWSFQLDESRRVEVQGRVDRLDLAEVDGQAYFIIVDYKSTAKPAQKKLIYNGIQQQPVAYLLALQEIATTANVFPEKNIRPGGFFYVPLNPKWQDDASRQQILDPHSPSPRTAFQHEGIFDFSILKALDPKERGEQFSYSLTQKGQPHGASFKVLKSADFQAVLQRARDQLRESALQVFEGDVRAFPALIGSQLACSQCDYLSLCRFDPEINPPRILLNPSQDS